MMGIVFCCCLLIILFQKNSLPGALVQFETNEFESLAFKTGDNFTNQATLDTCSHP